METKNICGKIPIDLHAKVRAEIEQMDISTHQFLQQVIEEHFMEKGVDSMAARTIAVQVTEELFGRLKAAVAYKGCKQKDFLIRIIEKAIAEIEDEQARDRLEKEALAHQSEPTEEAAEEPESEAEERDAEEPETETEEAVEEPESETVEGTTEEPKHGVLEESEEKSEAEGAEAPGEWEPQAEEPDEAPVA